MRTDRRPDFWTAGHRAFKAAKRKEFRAVVEAYEKFRQGCEYVRGYQADEGDLERSLKQWKESMSVKNWGR